MTLEERAREWLRTEMDLQDSPRLVNALEALLQAVRDEAIESAAKLIETRGENNRGIVHPIDEKHAAAVRALKGTP